MEATTELAELADFFDRYGTALTMGDLPAIARCYRLPGTVVSGGYSFTFSSPAAVALSFVGAAPAYQDARGHAVPGEAYRYIIRLGAPTPQICVVMPTG